MMFAVAVQWWQMETDCLKFSSSYWPCPSDLNAFALVADVLRTSGLGSLLVQI